MELSSEDNLRLNVLIASRPQAIRIDESRLVVYGLSERGEAKVALNPSGAVDGYLRAVKELISGHILGSPGGYPVYLRRWTRMGQMRDQSLEQLLMLGESEAVVAAVGSPGLTPELARRAWWAMEDAENARRMLRNPTIVASEMGPVLADYLVEYLPFETDHETMMESVRLVLQPGLLSDEKILELWKKSTRKQAYLVGFLRARPDDLPEQPQPRADADEIAAALADELSAGNAVAGLLVRVTSAGGQRFLKTLSAVLAKPPNQDIVSAGFDLLRGYFAVLRPEGDPNLTIEALLADGEAFAGLGGDTRGGVAIDEAGSAPIAEQVQRILERLPAAAPDLAAMRVLSGAGYGLIRPLLPDPTTLGSLMRRKLTPAIDPLQAQISRLLG
ncbi:sulfur reduction protein DsrS [Lamprobacter modestohalophilus]|uniref:Sulfur reduction protein DsrS n=1 Tax=Lamprobacter modestohalophilus TaxID=1064514 RepID=A0A9X0W5M3_9GAMM|nr:sulfur reduction protein DsrS [Lamprobacter modestohalophilus]MBK1617242.1 sulfur reduction protein DsrS [Lamprobacter modestohalophilus]